MRIVRMKASFGGLRNRELALGEGLNIIQAPNEGGKSTWSAFLRAMLYGVNTKERDRQGYIAEKNRYQPWGGGPMEGSVELIWQGRSITLRRSAKGSTPFGQFEAVYTDTGAPVPGLTGANAGEVLTGEPREVFERSAFVGQGGAAIDGAPALEARIAALASSGEEDVSYSQVERRLRDWLNRRKHNKTGLIPRLEGELAELDAALARQAKAFRLSQEARREIDRLQAEHRLLEAERDAHLARAMEGRRQRWEAAQAALAQAQGQVDNLEAERTRHGPPPDRDTPTQAQEELNARNALHPRRKLAESQLEEARAAEAEAEAAAEDPLFPELTPDQAWQQASEDAEAAERTPRTGGLYAGGGILLAAGAAALALGIAGVLPALWMGLALCGVGLAAGVALMLVFWWAWAYVEKDEVRVFAANDVPGEIVLQNGTGTSVAIDADTEEGNLTRMGAVLTQRADTLGLAYTVAADQPVEQHTLSTPRGKDFRLTLADGTIVWLNAESRLEYPSRFTGSERRVRLKGEAYFQVAHNADVPFVVETECIRTRVLGTEFNLCSYAPADTHVTLIKGSVEVSSPQQTVPVRIEPGEEARLQADGSFALSTVDVDAYVYWKEGYFYFDNTPLADIMQAIGRWYNVNIVFRSRQAMTYKMHYFCERRKDIAHAVELLNMMGKVKATVEGNTVYVE